MRLLLASFIVLPLDDVCDQFSRAFSFNPRRSFGNIKYTLLSATPVVSYDLQKCPDYINIINPLTVL